MFGIGPVEAAVRRSARAGLSWDDIALVELNEAFASQSLACLREWRELDPAKLNVRGGAIAIGHPLGASGARIVGRLTNELRARGGATAWPRSASASGRGSRWSSRPDLPGSEQGVAR